MYSFKQSPCLLYKRFLAFLFIKLFLIQFDANYCIFVLEVGLNGSMLSVFMNNIKIIALKRSRIIERVKIELTIAFFIVDIEFISFYLELKVD